MHTKRLSAFALALALCSAPLATAQQGQQPAPPAPPAAPAAPLAPMTPMTPMVPMAPMAPMPPFEPMTFNFVSSEMSFDTRTVKGAPYTAEAVTETVQTLADGNRIVRRTSAQCARDSEGRTRREATVNLIGNVTGSNDLKPSTVFINDPIAGVNYVLNEKDRTARKLQSFNFDFSRFENGEFQAELSKRLRGYADLRKNAAELQKNAADLQKQMQQKFGSVDRNVSVTINNGERRVVITETKDGVTTTKEYTGKEADEALARLKAEKKSDADGKGFDLVIPADVFRGVPPGGIIEGVMSGGGGVNATSIAVGVNGRATDVKTENLGKQIVEGVEAEGTRTTSTIAAGAIGNERPIIITSERWYSPELKTVVMTRRNDPRHGETTYRLTNINRSEPPRSLFEVPADYTVKESPAAVRRVKRIETPKTNQQ